MLIDENIYTNKYYSTLYLKSQLFYSIKWLYLVMQQ